MGKAMSSGTSMTESNVAEQTALIGEYNNVAMATLTLQVLLTEDFINAVAQMQ